MRGNLPTDSHIREAGWQLLSLPLRRRAQGPGIRPWTAYYCPSFLTTSVVSGAWPALRSDTITIRTHAYLTYTRYHWPGQVPLIAVCPMCLLVLAQPPLSVFTFLHMPHYPLREGVVASLGVDDSSGVDAVNPHICACSCSHYFLVTFLPVTREAR